MDQVANKKHKTKETNVPGLKRKDYEQKLRKLHVELVKLQEWVKREGKKVCVVFEGRDGAGKGGVIKAMTERVSPRVFRVVALAAPTEREKSQMYVQRYMQHFPAEGEIVIFDRSWYNRAGVERVMGFCTEDQVKRFLNVVPPVEKAKKTRNTLHIPLSMGKNRDNRRSTVPCVLFLLCWRWGRAMQRELP